MLNTAMDGHSNQRNRSRRTLTSAAGLLVEVVTKSPYGMNFQSRRLQFRAEPRDMDFERVVAHVVVAIADRGDDLVLVDDLARARDEKLQHEPFAGGKPQRPVREPCSLRVRVHHQRSVSELAA